MEKDIVVFLHRDKSSYSNEYSYTPHSCDMSNYGYVLISQKTIIFDLPDENEMIQKEIAVLNIKAQKIKADAFVEVEKINEKIQSLLAIEDKG